MSSQPLQIGRRPDKERIAELAKLVRQAKLLAWLGVGWHGIEAAIAVVAQLGDAAHVTAALTGWKASRATIHLLGDAASSRPGRRDTVTGTVGAGLPGRLAAPSSFRTQDRRQEIPHRHRPGRQPPGFVLLSGGPDRGAVGHLDRHRRGVQEAGSCQPVRLFHGRTNGQGGPASGLGRGGEEPGLAQAGRETRIRSGGRALRVPDGGRLTIALGISSGTYRLPDVKETREGKTSSEVAKVAVGRLRHWQPGACTPSAGTPLFAAPSLILG